ncbi:hypothetical protein V6617_09990 [Pelagibacterium nitratireducens]|uniref:Uncharacterized protein n=1 Tax=Pelagibacterium nitratireducens TaxID=1046114 RepID=A0ABZ2HV13_9HYPH
MAALPAAESDQVRYTIHLNGRDAAWPQLTLEEARGALAAGIRFSIFNEHTGEFNISIPYATLRYIDRDMLTIIQD